MMQHPKLYKAFGLVIQSCRPIPQLQELTGVPFDVQVVDRKLRDEIDPKAPRVGSQSNVVLTLSDTIFRVTGGNLIEADVAEGDTEAYVGMYLMGSCMGAILIQRGFMLLHGSCVTDGIRSVLITGDSGSGKSTTAAEFLKRGWKLVTDDVTCVFEQDGIPMVRSSYPSQKLWQDAMENYEKTEQDVHSLYFFQNREKYGISVADNFYDGVCLLSMVVRLLPADHPTSLSPIEGMAKVDQLMRNTYRNYMIEKQHRQRHFQRCVTLSTKIPMALAIRENGKDCAPVLYDMITKFMEENCHD